MHRYFLSFLLLPTYLTFNLVFLHVKQISLRVYEFILLDLKILLWAKPLCWTLLLHTFSLLLILGLNPVVCDSMNLIWISYTAEYSRNVWMFVSQAGPGGAGRSAAGECVSLVRVAEAHNALSLWCHPHVLILRSALYVIQPPYLS